GQAVTELNFQSPETVCTWYTRWSDEFDAAELAAPFWRWQSRFTSLKELDWLRISGEPLYAVMYEIPLIVRETPEHIRVAERWQVPNKLADRSSV
ncbi:plasmid SOS inhibition protein A, partial [Klebsiella pneumoniae]